ncbi:glycosyltransferase family A protein [Paenibacillus sp. Soil766]|uniref:glycosyltransferase family A protein n=1 Tax=Paenibacillus sp. Soil766 TaxID=1736404 RepID=UPI000708EC62|nr:glycosyltransferase family A protein [Paenibacillus sp. Soil766]
MLKLIRKKRMRGQVSLRHEKKRILKKPKRRFIPKRKRSFARVNRTSVHPVGAIILASNAEGTIVHVLEPLKRLPLKEIIVIVHGSVDRTLDKVKRHSSAIIIHDPQTIEWDAARALAARISRSDFLLFIEGDEIVNADELLPSINNVALGIENGTLARRHELAINEHHYSNV